MDFIFTDEDLNISACDQESQFDKLLLSSWHSAMKAGHFRYTLDTTKTRVLPGERQIVVKFNKQRFLERRTPISVTSVDEPFNPERFNFTKAAKHETVMYLCYSKENETCDEKEYPVMINVAPLDVGHVVIVPQINKGFNQVLREDATLVSLRMLLLSNSKFFYVAFNSLMAHASVNHLHLHGWYGGSQLPSSVAALKELSKEFNLFTFEDYPVNGFVFFLDDVSNVKRVSHWITVVANHLHSSNISHNIFMCRGFVSGRQDDRSGVRICIWPRKLSVGDDKGANEFNIAVAELAGVLACKNEEFLTNADEKTILSYVADVHIGDEIFDRLTAEILQCLRES